MHFRIEIGRWWLQIGQAEPESPPSEPEHDPPPFIDHHPTPQVVYTPERVGFHCLPSDSD